MVLVALANYNDSIVAIMCYAIRMFILPSILVVQIY